MYIAAVNQSVIMLVSNPSSHIMKPIFAKVLKYTPLVLITPLALIFLSSVLYAEPSADELAREARELRLKAMKGHCSIIGQKVAQCYAGDRKTCDSLQGSLAWFTSEYSQTPELACQAEDPLELGGGQE